MTIFCTVYCTKFTVQSKKVGTVVLWLVHCLWMANKNSRQVLTFAQVLSTYSLFHKNKKVGHWLMRFTIKIHQIVGTRKSFPCFQIHKGQLLIVYQLHKPYFIKLYQKSKAFSRFLVVFDLLISIMQKFMGSSVFYPKLIQNLKNKCWNRKYNINLKKIWLIKTQNLYWWHFTQN